MSIIISETPVIRYSCITHLFLVNIACNNDYDGNMLFVGKTRTNAEFNNIVHTGQNKCLNMSVKRKCEPGSIFELLYTIHILYYTHSRRLSRVLPSDAHLP